MSEQQEQQQLSNAFLEFLQERLQAMDPQQFVNELSIAMDQLDITITSRNALSVLDSVQVDGPPFEFERVESDYPLRLNEDSVTSVSEKGEDQPLVVRQVQLPIITVAPSTVLTADVIVDRALQLNEVYHQLEDCPPLPVDLFERFNFRRTRRVVATAMNTLTRLYDWSIQHRSSARDHDRSMDAIRMIAHYNIYILQRSIMESRNLVSHAKLYQELITGNRVRLARWQSMSRTVFNLVVSRGIVAVVVPELYPLHQLQSNRNVRRNEDRLLENMQVQRMYAFLVGDARLGRYVHVLEQNVNILFPDN